MKRILYLINLLAVIHSPSNEGGEEEPWEKKMDKNGIAVFTRKPEGSRIVGFKAISVIRNTTIQEIKEVIFNVEAFSTWINDCKSSEILESINKENLIYHVLVRVPFPFDKRDMVQQMRVTQESETSVKILLENKPDFAEKKHGIVRMPIADGFWQLDALNDGEVKVEFEYFSDPGGGIPPWMINMFIVKSPYNTLYNLRDLVQAD